MIEAAVTLNNPLGLHARAAAKVVAVANTFESNITIERPSCGRTADARSILSLLKLGAKFGSNLVIKVNGGDEEAALNAMLELFELGFGEN
ncbi:MAG: HPr family phosphocarrier protein [Pyrinomonadaceae bacterium]